MIKQDRGLPIQGTATSGTTATITFSGTTGGVFYITDYSASASAGTASFVIKDGSATIFQMQFGSTPYIISNQTSPIAGSSGNSMTVQVQGLNATQVFVNASGFQIIGQ